VKEFSVIEHFFKEGSYRRKDVEIGIGDDCAVTNVPDGQSLVVTTDTLISGIHFLEGTSAKSIAQKAMAVNLSDLAAMGAEPAWFSLSLSLPDVDEAWLAEFASSLHEMSHYYGIQLIGGDTVQGPLAITITAHGFIPKGQGLKRTDAKPGDSIYVTGTLGDAGIGLDLLKTANFDQSTEHQFLVDRLNFPTPRVLAGTTLRRIANACIDVSDGLIIDLKRILKASGCGASVQVDNMPLSDAMRSCVSVEEGIQWALSSGDDYELLFTISEEQKGNLEVTLANSNVKVTCIGHINSHKDALTLTLNDKPYEFNLQGFEHFS
jgi:thiamine-monophosphate kinase